jgi:hypothetical protein
LDLLSREFLQRSLYFREKLVIEARFEVLEDDARLDPVVAVPEQKPEGSLLGQGDIAKPSRTVGCHLFDRSEVHIADKRRLAN